MLTRDRVLFWNDHSIIITNHRMIADLVIVTYLDLCLT